jgi:hypothetical protein
LDQIYGACYIVTFGLFAPFVWTSNRLDTTREEDRPGIIARLNRVDVRFQWICAVFLVSAVVLNVVFPTR